MILRIYNSILEALHKNTIVNGNQLNDLVLFYTYLSHKCSQIEFMDKYNIKDINWAERTTKVKETLPGWRKNPNGSPPTIPINFYAKNLILNINRLDLDPNVLESRFQHQLSKIEELHAQKEAGNEPTISLNSTSIPNSSTAHPLTHGNSVHTDRGLHYETRVPRPPARRQNKHTRHVPKTNQNRYPPPRFQPYPPGNHQNNQTKRRAQGHSHGTSTNWQRLHSPSTRPTHPSHETPTTSSSLQYPDRIHGIQATTNNNKPMRCLIE